MPDLFRREGNSVFEETPDTEEHFHAWVVSLNALVTASGSGRQSISLNISP